MDSVSNKYLDMSPADAEIRNAFGLRSDYSASHCRGSGEDGQEYVPPSALRRTAGSSASQVALAEGPSDTDENCPLVRIPATCVRGFLALVRRDAEAGWWVICHSSPEVCSPAGTWNQR